MLAKAKAAPRTLDPPEDNVSQASAKEVGATPAAKRQYKLGHILSHLRGWRLLGGSAAAIRLILYLLVIVGSLLFHSRTLSGPQWEPQDQNDAANAKEVRRFLLLGFRVWLLSGLFGFLAAAVSFCVACLPKKAMLIVLLIVDALLTGAVLAATAGGGYACAQLEIPSSKASQVSLFAVFGLTMQRHQLTRSDPTQLLRFTDSLQQDFECCGLTEPRDWWYRARTSVRNPLSSERVVLTIPAAWLPHCLNATAGICYAPLSCCRPDAKEPRLCSNSNLTAAEGLAGVPFSLPAPEPLLMTENQWTTFIDFNQIHVQPLFPEQLYSRGCMEAMRISVRRYAVLVTSFVAVLLCVHCVGFMAFIILAVAKK